MKQGLNGMAFGFSSVNAGQRNSSVSPQFVALSTPGGFKITAPVSMALGIASGDNVMFINNIKEINSAIVTKHPDLVAFCEENNLDITTPEAAVAIHKAFDVWAIAKGIVEKDARGNICKAVDRMSKDDRIRFVNENFDDMLNEALNSDNEELKAALTAEGITRDEQVELMTPFVRGNEVNKYMGSRCANPSNLNGIGNTLTFTDTNVWNQIKADLKEDERKNVNRIFEVSIDPNDILDIPMNDGYEDVIVKAIRIDMDNFTDKEPVSRKNAEK